MPEPSTSTAARLVGRSPGAPRPALNGHGHPVRRTGAQRPAGELLRLAVVPALVIVAFLVLAALAVVGDQTNAVPAFDDARRAVSHLIGKDAATSTLQAVATGLVTVTSITFSVLLLAVQQTASNLSPVVFDQFLRRRSNQAFVGFFVGLVLFAYVAMTAVQGNTPPILGAALATVMTIVALFILLALVFSTIDQMRPSSVVRVIRQGAIGAREREADLVRRTRRERTGDSPVQAVHRADRTGYLVAIDLDRLSAALQDAGAAEVVLHVTVGDHVSYGQLVAEVHDGDPGHARAVADRVAGALQLSAHRNLGADATTGVDELANIAWTSGSTSKQNPEVAREALLALQDLAMRWLLDDPASGEEGSADQLPVVYRDNDIDRILDVFYDQLVAAHESHQHMIAATVLDGYRMLLDAAPQLRDRLASDVATAARLLDESPPSTVLATARRRFAEAVGGDAG